MTAPRKLTDDEMTQLQRWCADDGLHRLFYEAHQRLPFIESLLAEVEETVTRQFVYSSDGGIVVPNVRYCQWCYGKWNASWDKTAVETHKDDCLYMRLRQAVQP